jgi:hypothetical protein
VPNALWAWKSFWAQTMELLGYVGEMEARFGPFGDSVNLDIGYMHCLCRTYYMLGNHFWRNRWHSYVTWVKWKLITIHLEIVLISSVEGTIGSKSIWDAPDCNPR